MKLPSAGVMLHFIIRIIIIQYESFYYSFRIVFAFLLGDCLCFLLSRTMIKVLQEESLLHQKRKVLLIIASKTGFNLEKSKAVVV